MLPLAVRAEQEAPVGVGLREHRREVAIADRERARPASRRTAGRSGRSTASPARLLALTKPSLRPPLNAVWLAFQLWRDAEALARRVASASRARGRPVGVGIGVRRLAVLVDLEAVDLVARRDLVGQHPEEVVERVVLHHQDDDVLDLRHRRRALGQARERQRSGTGGLRRRRPTGRVQAGRPPLAAATVSAPAPAALRAVRRLNRSSLRGIAPSYAGISGARANSR